MFVIDGLGTETWSNEIGFDEKNQEAGFASQGHAIKGKLFEMLDFLTSK